MKPAAQVFIQTAFLGDVLLSVPFFLNWRFLVRDRKKILICRAGLGNLFKQLGLVDEVFEVKKGDSSSYQRVLAELKSFDIDIVFSAHQSIRTALFVKQIKAKRKIGYRNFLSWLSYSDSIAREDRWPEPLRLLQLLTPIDASIKDLLYDYRQQYNPYTYEPGQSLSAPPQWAQTNIRDLVLLARKGLQEERLKISPFKKKIAIFPGSVWATKRWTVEGFQRLTDKVLSLGGYQVLLMGGAEERALCEQVKEGAVPTLISVNKTRAGVEGAVLNLAGDCSLLESLSVLAQCELVVSNDSAGAHLGSLVGATVLAIFGPTVLEFGYRPWAKNTFITEEKDLFCRPCGPHGHKVCPLGTHECMQSLDVDRVFHVLTQALLTTAPPEPLA